MQLNENPTTHCLKVPKVFDQVNNSLVIKLKKIVHLKKKRLDDLICCDFCIPCGEVGKSTLWTTYGLSQIGGSICINFKRGCGSSLAVFVNGEKQANINEGSSFSATFTHLDSIEVQCNGKSAQNDHCYGDFKLMLHFYQNDKCDLNSVNDIKSTICHLSDCHGNLVSLNDDCFMTCKELTCPEDRVTVPVINQLGKTVFLQRVDLLKQGFICIQFINHNGKTCLKCIIPFYEVDSVVLCAPQETEINCTITNVDCKAHVIPSVYNNMHCIEAVIILSICQSISSVADVFIELNGTICRPRRDLNDEDLKHVWYQ